MNFHSEKGKVCSNEINTLQRGHGSRKFNENRPGEILYKSSEGKKCCKM